MGCGVAVLLDKGGPVGEMLDTTVDSTPLITR